MRLAVGGKHNGSAGMTALGTIGSAAPLKLRLESYMEGTSGKELRNATVVKQLFSELRGDGQ